MNFKKRRHHKALNKNEQKVRRQNSGSGPSLGNFYPQVQKLSISLDFFSPEGHLLEQDVREFEPADPIDFAVPCPGRCGDGRMDLEGKLRDMLNRRQPTAQATAQCRYALFGDSNNICGCELRCAIHISYNPEPTPAL